MKMLTLICREQLQDEVLMFLDSQGIFGYTMMRGAAGGGETGRVTGLHGALDRNHVFLIVLDDSSMQRLLEEIKHFHATLVEQNKRQKIPLKVFVQSCDVVF